MEFLYSLVTQFDPDEDLRGVGEALAREARRAAEWGFDAVRCGEHHVTDDQYLYNEAVLAHVADHAGDLWVQTGLCLLPLHDPVRIAEYGATMDVLTGGRFRLAVGQGYRDAEFHAYGVDRRDSVGRLVEGLEVIDRLWRGETVTHAGEHLDLDGVAISPTPVQSPRPAIWVGASNESSVRRAARLADGWWGSHAPLDVLADYAAAYREERSAAGLDDGVVGITREVFVAETDAAAEAAIREPLMRKYASYVDWGQDEVFERDDFRAAWDRLAADRFVVGSPETVVAELERYRDRLGLDFLAPRMKYPGMAWEDVEPSLELFADEVMPELR